MLKEAERALDEGMPVTVLGKSTSNYYGAFRGTLLDSIHSAPGHGLLAKMPHD
jgi:hypothetical protein